MATLRNAKGKPSFEINNVGDLDDAVRAVGRVRPNTPEARARVRRYIMREAQRLGATSHIPATWAKDGSLK